MPATTVVTLVCRERKMLTWIIFRGETSSDKFKLLVRIRTQYVELLGGKLMLVVAALESKFVETSPREIYMCVAASANYG